MIPILFGAGATSFTSNGIGRLTDTINCTVEEERNGAFTLVLEYLANGANYDKLLNGNLIVADANHKLKRQAFEIYKVTTPINGKVQVFANHISYRQSYVPIKPFIATGITDTLAGFSTYAVEASPFTFTTDLVNEESTYNQSMPKSLRACLGGTEGSLLDTFSGSVGVEYEFDNFNTFVTLQRGSNNGVQLRYGKNITDLTQEKSIENAVTGVVPYWASSDGSVILMGDAQYNSDADLYAYHRTELLNLSQEYETTPSVAELNEAGARYVNAGALGKPKTNIKVTFIEAPAVFGNVEIYESVNLCDTVKVIYTPLGITFNSKVVKTEYDVLRERYNSIEIGEPKSNIGKTLTATISEISTQIVSNRTISITQQIDEELGEIRTSVSAINSQINDEETGLRKVVQTQGTLIDQKVDSITFTAYQETVEGEFEGVADEIEEIRTTLSVDTEGVKVKQGEEDNYFLITDSNAQVIVDGQQSAVFGAEGTDTTKLTLDGTWHQDTVNDGNTYILYYLEV